MQDWGAWHCGAPLLSFCWVLAAIILNTTTQLYVVLVGLNVRELCCADPTVQLNDFSNILWFIYLNFKDLYLEKSPLWLATEPLYVPVVGSWMASNCCCMEQKVRKQIKGYLLWLSHALGRVLWTVFYKFLWFWYPCSWMCVLFLLPRRILTFFVFILYSSSDKICFHGRKKGTQGNDSPR